jgi:subtilisin-like proprotein convertase family protein
VTVEPYTPTSGKIVKIRGPHYSPKQYLLLENRTRTGFDSALPGQGLLVWRVDERLKMTSPASPAMLLIQADGRHDLERADDYNAGDDGDPFPGQAGRTFLGDTGDISTTFPGGDRSEVALKNIRHDPISNSIQLDVEIGATESVVSELDTIYKRIEVNTAIPDNNAAGISSPLRIEENGIVRGIQVAVDISHTYIGDLKVELISPSGEWAVLHDHMGGGAKNLATAYSSENHAALAALTGNPVKGDWVLHVSDDVVHDTGKLNHWAIQIFRSEIRNDNRIQVESAPALAIPDNDPGGAGDAISISRAGTVRDLLVKIKVTHSYIGDLLIELIGPRGDRAILHNKAGSNSKNIDKTYTLTDQSALGAFVGSPTQGNWVLWASDHAARDIGKLDRWSLDIGLGAGSQVARGDANVDVEIPDNLPAGIASAIHIAETGSAQSVRVGVVIHHGYVGDLRVELVAPDGDRALLHNRGVQSAENLVRSYDSVNHLELGKLRGKAIRGNWFLRVTDTAYRDVGRLISWSIQLPYTA